jgi:hypothetical protein
METGKKGNREFRFFLSEIRRSGKTWLYAICNHSSGATRRMRHIDLIDWTSMKNQPSVDYAKPHLQPLCLSGVQISLDAFSGSHAEI